MFFQNKVHQKEKFLQPIVAKFKASLLFQFLKFKIDCLCKMILIDSTGQYKSSSICGSCFLQGNPFAMLLPNNYILQHLMFDPAEFTYSNQLKVDSIELTASYFPIPCQLQKMCFTKISNSIFFCDPIWTSRVPMDFLQPGKYFRNT